MSATASDISEASTAYQHHDRRIPPSHKFDKMMWFFWIPVLLLVLSATLYANFDYLRPSLDTALDLVLPRSVVRSLHN